MLDTELTPQQQHFMDIMQTACQALLQIVDDVLDFSKLEAGKMVFECIDFELRSCVEELGDMLGFKAHEKGIELIILIHHDVPTHVRGDPGRLRQVLTNLVNNAIKFTDRGEVMLRVGRSRAPEGQCGILFEVSDTGRGIPAEQMDSLFESFVQLDPSNTRRHGGAGLGLTIASQLVEGMGGRIDVESAAGQGSIFSFTLHLEAAQSPAGPGRRPRRDVCGIRVLVADGNARSRLVCCEQLAKWGCEAGESSSIAETVAKLHEAAATVPYHVALIDRSVADPNGLELGRQIKKDPLIASTELILLTSTPQRGDAAEAAAAGFSAYLPKPVGQFYFYEALTRVLGVDGKTPYPLITQHSINEAAHGAYCVLLAEDNVTNQKMAAAMLGRLGYRYDVAGNGQEALEALANRRYDLILMDCQMPVLDGFETARRIREQESPDQHLPIVAMTAAERRGVQARCMQAGMDECLHKPVSLKELQAVLDRLMQVDEELIMEGASVDKNGGTPVDLTRIREAADGDRDFECELFTLFIDDCGTRITQLELSVDTADGDGCRAEAHTIKGASANVGAQKLYDLAVAMEKTDPESQPDAAAALLAQIKAEFDRVQRFLRAYMSQ